MKSDEKQKDEPPRTATEKQTEAKAADGPPKPKYEFKILPVDPKNSFDFEDVADK